MKKENKKLNHGVILRALDFGYEKAMSGIPGFDSAEELAKDYMNKGEDLIGGCNKLIRWQISKAGTSGFLTGLGGLITLPIAVPANVASVLYVQIRMILAIAHMGGYDVRDDRVKSLVYVCLAGNGAKDILKDIGIVLGQKLTAQIIFNISEKTISAINKRVGFKLLTKFGENGVINLGKAIPLVGGVIGGTFDSVATNAIGNVARKTFLEKNNNGK